MNYRILTSLFVLLLSACGPVLWNKPGATQADFSRDKYRCEQEAAGAYPAAAVNVPISPGYQQPAMTNCSGNSYNVNCMTTPGRYTPPATVLVDSNRNNRNAAFASCMNANGWYVQSNQAGQPQNPPGPDPLKMAMDEINKDALAAGTREELKAYVLKSAWNYNDISLEQLADKSKITAAEKLALSKALTEGQSIRNRIAVANRTYGGEKGAQIALIFNRSGPLHEKNATELYEGAITWGEYNKRRKEIAVNAVEEIHKVLQSK